ncbi:CRP/FNR family transcriptional regulator, anaerobic regulatory protein [Rhodovulum sp. ES.010]|uniref:Crp/Fnr family transcriptional regulator n=1 Tax=Rhodovulum sp. ES.010 TaxID=1882821 RepID=UPI00092AD998|nr:Crp/Fnr family transcriptional regulator [Rhodovulum sp. ES.010]SIO22800.1 CRP/FNR family transcriptional regulator, anaerobic regulatory protein [Rhodovulum sp. ES.010]
MATPDLQRLLSGPRSDLGSPLAELLDHLPAPYAEALADIARLAELECGAKLVEAGSRPEALGYLLDGALGMQRALPDGRIHIIGLLVPHDMYGRLFDGPSAFDIVALTDARVLTFRRDAFEDILRAAPEVERLFLVSVLDELDSAREWVLLMGGHKIVERVASFLLILLRRTLRSRQGRAPGALLSVRIPIRRSDLARYLGTTPETLSRSLHELEHDGAIRLRDAYDVELIDLPALVRISGADHLCGDGA